MLAGAVIVQRARLSATGGKGERGFLCRRPMRAAFERGLVQPRLRQHVGGSYGMFSLARMRGAGHRDFTRAKTKSVSRPRFHQGQRLDRLHRRARKYRPVDVADLKDHAPIRINDRNGSAVCALDDVTARHFNQNRICHYLVQT